MNHLFTPFNIKNITFRNRIVMPPMCMYSAGNDGIASPWHSFHYRTRAQGGAGLIIQEATSVESRGRISSNDLGIWSDSHLPGLSDIVKGIIEEGAVPGIQLAHAGRKCNAEGEDVIAPSPINFDLNDPAFVTPREMGRDDIEIVIESFKRGAERAAEAGYKILEIHGAHGYLLSSFLSPLTNTRSDEFGGSPRKRAEFLRLLIKAIRTVWKEENPLMLRVSAADWAEGGNKPEDLAEIIKLVKNEGLDIINVSSGGVVHKAKIPAAPGFQVPAAKIIKNLTGLPVIGGGLITNAGQAEEFVRNGDTDLVFLGRELLRNPFFPLLSSKEAGEEIDYWPKQYARAR
ncbi:MAG: NADH:flavin oxidoreductase/NADH oxidase [Spirochaetales bacterium]|nr:NADH:flavin oxidoreductase/NADH oxidase [Spirochaetales bacterium]